VIFLVAFDVARHWFYGDTWPGVPVSLERVVVSPLLSVVLVIAGLHGVARLLVEDISRWHLLLLPGSLLVAAVMSFVTIQVLPALHGETDSVHVVKMGYPAFWLAVCLPAASEVALTIAPDVQSDSGSKKTTKR
jgi:hypothetical protein